MRSNLKDIFNIVHLFCSYIYLRFSSELSYNLIQKARTETESLMLLQPSSVVLI